MRLYARSVDFEKELMFSFFLFFLLLPSCFGSWSRRRRCNSSDRRKDCCKRWPKLLLTHLLPFQTRKGPFVLGHIIRTRPNTISQIGRIMHIYALCAHSRQQQISLGCAISARWSYELGNPYTYCHNSIILCASIDNAVYFPPLGALLHTIATAIYGIDL